ncbi:unnamed protein product [Didymodactylos carnosus]|nr:unnamed protein product [Didymodactylos carnosus]CAF3534815.1 unnamed protein product [Didymodactylos carnosus]
MYASELSLKTPAMSKNEVTSLFDNNIRRTLFSDLNGRFQNLSNLSTVTNTLTPTINSEMNNSLDTSNPWQFRPKAGCSYLKPLSCEHLHTHIKHQFTNDKKHAYYSICCSTHGQIGRSRLRIGRGGRLLYDRRLPKESNELSSETKSHLAEKRILWRMPAKPDLTDDYKLHNHLTINNHDFDLSRKKFTNKSHTIIRVFNNTLMSLHSETNDSSYSVHKPSISTAGKFCPSFSSTNASVSAEEIDQSFIELDHPYSCTSKRITQALQTLTSTSELPSTPSSTILSPLCLCIDTPPTPPSTDPENDRSKAFTLPPTTSNMYNYPTTPPSVNHPNDTSTDSSNTNLTDSKLSTLLAFGSGQSLSLHSRFKNELLNNKNMRLFPSTSSTTTSENNISLLSSTAYAQLEQQQQIYNTTSSSSNNNNLLLNQMLTTALSNRLATVQPNLTSFSRSVSQTDSSSSHTNFPSIQPTTSTTSHFLLRVPAPGSINNQYNNLATNTPSKSSLFNSTTTNHRNVVIPSTTNETKNVLLPAPFTLFQHKTTNGYNGSISSFVAPTVKLSPIDSSSMITEVT